jgi:fumarate reductase flavoprotein subunit
MVAKEISENKSANFVIIGGGGAGLSAAVAAAEKGISVIVIEKMGATGGTSALAGGPFGADSPVQKRQGMVVKTDDLYKLAINWAHLKVNARLVRAFIDKSGDTIGWLEAKGIRFTCRNFVPDQIATWHVSNGGGAEIVKVLADECKRLGAEIITHAQPKKILTGDKGEVIGVVIEKGGTTFTISCGKLLLSAGGYGANRKLVKKYCPEYHDDMRFDGTPNMGETLPLATEIGAATEGLGSMMLAGPSVPQSIIFSVGAGDDIRPLRLRDIIREPYTVWVNKKGKRFIEETVGFNHYEAPKAVVRQLDNVSITIFDDKMRRMMIDEGLEQQKIMFAGAPSEQANQISNHGARPINNLPKGFEAGLAPQIEKGLAKISNSWDEIADWIGADCKVVKNTIDEYNADCDKGHDSVFAKDPKYLIPLKNPPYYAIKTSADYHCTMGSFKVNENLEVLDKQENIIPGLYAAGMDAGGWMSDTYCAITTGAALGFALNSGRIAGEHAARAIQS